MSTANMNGHAPRGHTRPRTLAAQTPREQVDEALAKTVAGEMPEIPPFLKEAAKEPREKSGGRSRAKAGEIKNPPNAKKDSAPPVARNLEPAGKELLRQQQKAKSTEKADRLKALREAKATRGAKPAAAKAPKANGSTKAKPVATAKAKPAQAKPEAAPADGKKTKVQIVAELLRRPGGCTAADVLSATGWPAVSMPQQAKAAGITLLKEKEAGKPTRYCAG